MYTIKIRYEAGDSFHDYTESDYINLAWNDINQAKKALQEIKEHYEVTTELESFDSSFRRAPIESRIEELKKYPWFNPDAEIYCSVKWTSSILLEHDNGERRVVSTFWTGYFERILEATITVEETKETCITF